MADRLSDGARACHARTMRAQMQTSRQPTIPVRFALHLGDRFVDEGFVEVDPAVVAVAPDDGSPCRRAEPTTIEHVVAGRRQIAAVELSAARREIGDDDGPRAGDAPNAEAGEDNRVRGRCSAAGSLGLVGSSQCTDADSENLGVRSVTTTGTMTQAAILALFSVGRMCLAASRMRQA